MAGESRALRFENDQWRNGAVRVVGMDEVGVAPTCGAVVAAAVIMKPHARRIPGVRDSKTLSALQRERLAPIIRRRAVAVGVGAASVREIDTINIYHATHLAMRRAVARLGGHDHVLVDGNRIAGFEAAVGPYTAIVDGDARCYTIACASVVAKVVRDRMMTLLAARYPGYGWEHNQGYATRDHRDAIRALGPHAVPPPELPRAPADPGRRPDQPRPVRRGGRDDRAAGRRSPSSTGSTACATTGERRHGRPDLSTRCRRPRRSGAAAAIAEAEAIVREVAEQQASASGADPIG